MVKSAAALVLCFWFLEGCSTAQSIKEPVLLTSPAKSLASVPSQQVVVTYHSQATEVGLEILKQGGNAFDAFVAATAIEYVLGEGVTSLAGPLGALLYDSRTKKIVYLDATFDDALDPGHKVNPISPQPGSSVLVPGAVAGLEAISKKYGNLSFKTVLDPAIHLAENGFALSNEYAGLLRSSYGERLKRSTYALKTFFRDGKALAPGETLKLPVVARFLRKVAKYGSKYVYGGAWARACIKEVNSQGGHLQLKDFMSYKAKWETPTKISYRGLDIYSPQNKGGLNTLLSLKVLEQTDLLKYKKHYSASADALEILGRIQLEVSQEPWLYDQTKIKDLKLVEEKLSPAYAAGIWRRVEQKIASASSARSGSHSYHIIVVDRDGNTITGTNTIESFPWGNAIFVEGIPLTASGELPFGTKPGERRLSPLSMQIGMKADKIRFASGAFSASLLPAEFQFIVNIVDYDLPATEVVTRPRFGSFAFDMQTRKMTDVAWLDPRIDQQIVSTLLQRGLKFTQEGYIDTGLGSVAIVNDNGLVEGAFAPMSSLGQSAKKIVGIGIALDLNEKHQIFIREVYADTPAEKAGLRAGDVLLAVQTLPESDRIGLESKTPEDAVNLIRGAKDTTVILEVQHQDGNLNTYRVIRDEFRPKKK